MYQANHKSMAVVMRTESVDACLLHIGHIAQTEGEPTELQIGREPMTQRWLPMKRGEDHSTIGMTERKNLVVGLSVLGRKHHPQEREVHLITESERTTFPRKMILSHTRGGQIGIQTGLSRIVPIAGVVSEPSMDLHHGTCGKAETLARQIPVVVKGIVPVDHTGQLTACPSHILCSGQIALEQCLPGHMPLHPTGHTDALAKHPDLSPTVFHWRQISIVEIDASHSVHSGTHNGTGRILICCLGRQTAYSTKRIQEQCNLSIHPFHVFLFRF